MTPVLRGFLKEATALSAAKKALKVTMKHPMLVIGAGATGVGTALAAREAHKRGLRGDEKARYIAASYDPISGRTMASRAAYTNLNPLYRRELSDKKKKAVSKHYKEKNFRG